MTAATSSSVIQNSNHQNSTLTLTMVKFVSYGPLAAALLAAPSAHAFFTPPSSAVVVKNQPKQQYSPLSSSSHKKHELAFNNNIPTTTTSLRSSSSSDINPYTSPQLDTDALLKYATSAITELTLFAATFQLLDVTFTQLLDLDSIPIPFAFLVFYGCSLKSRVFNPLNNQRPDRSKAVDGEGSSGFRDRVMPSWTPPGVTFPIMW